jgi:hypothetical protein
MITSMYAFAIMNDRILGSSNIRFISYNDRTQILKIIFNGGAAYEYRNVSVGEWEDILNGNATASTLGSNRWGSWFPGKRPSTGAAVHRYLIAAGKPYKRI